jgi:hypothetical protein
MSLLRYRSRTLDDKLDDSYLPGRSLPGDASSMAPQTFNLTCVSTSRIVISAGVMGVMNCAAVDVMSNPVNCTAGCMRASSDSKLNGDSGEGKVKELAVTTTYLFDRRLYNIGESLQLGRGILRSPSMKLLSHILASRLHV